MPNVILTARHTPDSQVLGRAAAELGRDVERLPSWLIPDHLKHLAEPVIYDEARFAWVVAAEFGVDLKEPPEDWLPRLPDAFRKRTGALTSLGKALGLAFTPFVKPPNDRCFPARVCVLPADLPTTFPDDLPVLASEVVTWEKESRCFALDSKVATSSVYLRDGAVKADNEFASEPAELAEATVFAEEALRGANQLSPTRRQHGIKGPACFTHPQLTRLPPCSLSALSAGIDTSSSTNDRTAGEGLAPRSPGQPGTVKRAVPPGPATSGLRRTASASPSL